MPDKKQETNRQQAMSAFYGRNSHAQHHSNAGGYAGRTIDEAYVAQELAARGNIGFNAETSTAIVPHDDEGSVVLFPVREGGYKPPHFEVVRSARRNPQVYPNASSFRLKFSKPLKSVFAIEVLDINVPNVDSTVPVDREFLLVNGLFDSDGNFKAQENIGGGAGIFNAMMTHDTNDPGVVRNAASTAANSLYNWDSHALASFDYDATKSFQSWSRDGWHRTRYFATPVQNLDYLDLSLVDPEGNQYDFAVNEEWKCTLQIICKA